MADTFDPTQFGAVAVDEPQPFDPTAHGAVPVQEEQPSGVEKVLNAAQQGLGYAQKGLQSAMNPVGEFHKLMFPEEAKLVEQPLISAPTLTSVVQGLQGPQKAILGAAFGETGKRLSEASGRFLGEQLSGLTSPESLALLAVAPAIGKLGGIRPPEVPQSLREVAFGKAEPATPIEAATEPLPQEVAPVTSAPTVEPQISPAEIAANREIAPVTEPPSATEVAPDPFPSISQGAEAQRRVELQQEQSRGVREAISLDELRLMRERGELQMQNDIAQRVTGATHPAVDERLGQIDEELTNIANTELQKAAAEQKPPEPEGAINAVQEPSAGEILQREPQETGTTRSERGRVEPSVQGEETSQTRQRTEAGTQETANGVTPEAQDLIDKGGVPAFVSKNLKRIATENGVEVGNKTPNEIIDELKAKAQPQQTEAVPPTVTSGVGGVNAAAMEQRPIETPEVGKGVGKEETRAAGHEWLDKGGDINKVMSDFSRTGKVSEWDVGKGAAYLERLQSVTDNTADALRSNPNDPILQQQYGQALAREQTFSDAFKPMATTASNTLKGFQGKTTLSDEMADSFSGLNRKFREFQGKEMTPEEAVKADRLAKKNAKAKSDYSEASQNLYKKADDTYKAVKGPSHVPTIQELAKALTGAFEEVC